ncbi:MAG: CBS domain-containing protein, partial [Cyanobacteria bacterium J06642_11]
MDLIICHTPTDFDVLGAAVGLSCALPEGQIVLLAKNAQPSVKSWLLLYRDKYPLIEPQAVTLAKIRSITLVDCYLKSRLGEARVWVEHAIAAQLPITTYGHHSQELSDISGRRYIEPVGATTTLVSELLHREGHLISPLQATLMALGIHDKTRSLTSANTSPQDGYALAWLMEQGAHQKTIITTLESVSPNALDVMSSPVRTIHPETTMADAHSILLRYGHSGLCVVNDADQLQGMISRRD